MNFSRTFGCGCFLCHEKNAMVNCPALCGQHNAGQFMSGGDLFSKNKNIATNKYGCDIFVFLFKLTLLQVFL